MTYKALIEAHPTCGCCGQLLKENGWGGITVYMTITAGQAEVLPDVINFHGLHYARLPVCAKCLNPESYPEHIPHPMAVA